MAMNFNADNAIDAATPTSGRQTRSLRRKIRAGFLLAILLMLMTSIGLTVPLTGIGGNAPFTVVETSAGADGDAHAQLLQRMRYGLLAGTLLALAILSALYIFVAHRILHPLERVAAAAGRMAAGRLDTTVPVQDRDEIGRIGELFNDMAINLQEFLLLVWNQTGSALDALDGIHRQLEDPQLAPMDKAIQAHLQSARQNLGSVQTVARSFDLYDVLLTGHKAVAIEDVVDRAH